MWAFPRKARSRNLRPAVIVQTVTGLPRQRNLDQSGQTTIGNLRTDRQLLHVLYRAQHDPESDQIVDDSRGPSAIGTAGAHLIDQRCGRQR